MRRFVCSNVMCTRRTFAERLGEPIKAYARRTKRCASRLQTIGLMLGGNAGALLAKRLGLLVSSDTLLRLVRALQVPEQATPEVPGIDAFALRKGQTYGTILVDLEERHVVDLLPDRAKTTVAAWLKVHPGVRVISRDRGGSYAEAGREAAPLAIQIADRFHLSQNLGETLERILRREYPTIEQIFGGAAQGLQAPDPSLPFQRHEADKHVSQQRRITVYERVISLSQQGVTIFFRVKHTLTILDVGTFLTDYFKTYTAHHERSSKLSCWPIWPADEIYNAKLSIAFARQLRERLYLFTPAPNGS